MNNIIGDISINTFYKKLILYGNLIDSDNNMDEIIIFYNNLSLDNNNFYLINIQRLTINVINKILIKKKINNHHKDVIFSIIRYLNKKKEYNFNNNIVKLNNNIINITAELILSQLYIINFNKDEYKHDILIYLKKFFPQLSFKFYNTKITDINNIFTDNTYANNNYKIFIKEKLSNYSYINILRYINNKLIKNLSQDENKYLTNVKEKILIKMKKINEENQKNIENKYIKIETKLSYLSTNNCLIIGAGPIGLFLALKINNINNLCTITILEERKSIFTRDQIVLINKINYNEINSLISDKELIKENFGIIGRPRFNQKGQVKKNFSKEHMNYSISVGKLQEILFNETKKIKNINIIQPSNGKFNFVLQNNTLTYSQNSIKIKNNILLTDYNKIFLCSGGKDKVSERLRDNLPNLYDLENKKLPIAKGYAAILKFKDQSYADSIKNRFLSNNSQFEELNNSFNGQNRYRMFISPQNNNKYIYLGIQFSENELESYNYLNNMKLNDDGMTYIKECIKVGCNFYNFNYDNFIEVTNKEVFDIKLSYCYSYYNYNENTGVFLVGDSKTKVNFFSGMGLNIGITNVLAIIELTKKNYYDPLKNVKYNNRFIEEYLFKNNISQDIIKTTSLAVTKKTLDTYNINTLKNIIIQKRDSFDKDTVIYTFIDEYLNEMNINNIENLAAITNFLISCGFIN